VARALLSNPRELDEPEQPDPARADDRVFARELFPQPQTTEGTKHDHGSNLHQSDQRAHDLPGREDPEAVTSAYADAQRLSVAARELGSRDGVMSAAVIDALMRGKDPAADREVQRLSVLSSIANPGIGSAIEAHGTELIREALADHADEIVNAWRPGFDSAVAVLLDAFVIIGDLALDDSDAVLQRGAAATDAWANATKADDRVRRITEALQALGNFTRLTIVDKRHAALRLVDVDFQTWQSLALAGRQLSGWDAVRAGLTPSLPTLAEYRVRVRTLQEAQAAPEMVVDTRRSSIAGREIRVPR